MPLSDIFIFVFLSVIGIGILEVLSRMQKLEQVLIDRLERIELGVEEIKSDLHQQELTIENLPDKIFLTAQLNCLREKIKRDREEEFLEEKQESNKQKEKRLERLKEAFSLPKSSLD